MASGDRPNITDTRSVGNNSCKLRSISLRGYSGTICYQLIDGGEIRLDFG